MLFYMDSIIELNNFTVAFLLIRKTWDDQFAGNSVHPLFSARGEVEGDYWERGGHLF